jgi:hypothetical protein
MKIVVFDLDETLGYFVEFSIFLDCLNRYLINNDINYKLTQENFNDILDLYPEFLRPNIINILNYLKNKKISKCCNKMMIYTNNQGPKKWVIQLISYFESKINYVLFDQIISAFKINGKKIELCRTSHDKSYSDLIKCTQIPNNSEICFLDDNYFPEMSNNNVYYIHVKPYTHDLRFDEMIIRFLNSKIGKIINNKLEDENNDFKDVMMNEFKQYNFNCIDKNVEEYDVDKILGKQIMNHLHFFFNKSLKTKTKKNILNKKNINNKNRSRKKY